MSKYLSVMISKNPLLFLPENKGGSIKKSPWEKGLLV
jgi:hypothetical protein